MTISLKVPVRRRQVISNETCQTKVSKKADLFITLSTVFYRFFNFEPIETQVPVRNQLFILVKCTIRATLAISLLAE